MKQLIIYLFIIFVILSCTTIQQKDSYLMQEISKYFPIRNYNSYIVGREKEILESQNHGNEYLKLLYEFVKNKTIPSTKYFPEYNENAYSFGEAYIRIIGYLNEIENIDKNLLLKIFIEINKKPDADYISGFTHGLYKTYHKLLLQLKDSVQSELIIEFINSLPDLKLIVLAEYKELLDFNNKPDINMYYKAYKVINYDNFMDIFANKKIFPYSTKEEREKYVENISYYFKLQDFLN